jgi:hypothetical protein
MHIGVERKIETGGDERELYDVLDQFERHRKPQGAASLSLHYHSTLGVEKYVVAVSVLA